MKALKESPLASKRTVWSSVDPPASRSRRWPPSPTCRCCRPPSGSRRATGGPRPRQRRRCASRPVRRIFQFGKRFATSRWPCGDAAGWGVNLFPKARRTDAGATGVSPLRSSAAELRQARAAAVRGRPRADRRGDRRWPALVGRPLDPAQALRPAGSGLGDAGGRGLASGRAGAGRRLAGGRAGAWRKRFRQRRRGEGPIRGTPRHPENRASEGRSGQAGGAEKGALSLSALYSPPVERDDPLQPHATFMG